MIAIFGGGEIAAKGIIPVVGGQIVDFRALQSAALVRMTMGELEPAPDTVIYTAGVSRPAALGSPECGDWAHEIGVNLIGAFNVADAAVHAGVKTLIFIASLAGLYGKPNHAGYCASKAGLISLVQSLAMEGRNAYAISPGRVNTGMRERDYPGEDPKTRLDPLVIGGLVADILAGWYTPGDNIVIRMRGHEVLPVEVHRGDGWRERLKVGEPPTC